MEEKLLIVESEQDIRSMLGESLRQEGYDVLEAASGQECLTILKQETPCLVLLTYSLPDATGLDICRHLKGDASTNHIPVIIVFQSREDVDKILREAPEADDYIVKPFTSSEILLRVRATMARTRNGRHPPETKAVLNYGPIMIAPARHEVRVKGRLCILTAKEFGLLYQLASHPGEIQNRQSLLDSIWGDAAFVTPRTVDTHVRRLRQKLGKSRNMIETIRGVGYRFKHTDQ